MSTKRTPLKPTPAQVIRRLILVLLGWVWRAFVIIAAGMVVIFGLSGMLLVMLLVCSLFWMPWPEDWFIQTLMYFGLTLWACALAAVVTRLYYFAYEIELKKRGLL